MIMPDIDQPIDSGMLVFNQALADALPPGSENLPLAQQRTDWEAVCAKFRSPRPAGIVARDIIANTVRCRLFHPVEGNNFPAVIYGHGGGWVLGSPETHDDMCAELADAAQCAVLLVDYRLAPEYPHPAQLEDCLKVWRWVRERGAANGMDPNRIIAAGDSAGGQMSAALAITLRDLGLPQLLGMVLIYPVLGADMQSESYVRNAHAPCLSRDEMMFYLNSFLGPEGSPAWHDEKALPNLLQNPAGLPPAFITVAAHDPLHDDGVIFHEKLLAAGVPSTLRREAQLAHSYMRARHHSPPAIESFKAIGAALKAMAQG